MSVFEIDTKGTCLFCLNPSGKTPNSPVALKMVLRYLKIDIAKLHQFSSQTLHFLDGCENVDVRASLCDDCDSLTERFHQSFKTFDKARMELDLYAQELHTKIQHGGEVEARVGEYRKRVNTNSQDKKLLDLIHASIAEALRMETSRKCALRLNSSVPIVTITGLDAPIPTSSAGTGNIKPDPDACEATTTSTQIPRKSPVVEPTPSTSANAYGTKAKTKVSTEVAGGSQSEDKESKTEEPQPRRTSSRITRKPVRTFSLDTRIKEEEKTPEKGRGKTVSTSPKAEKSDGVKVEGQPNEGPTKGRNPSGRNTTSRSPRQKLDFQCNRYFKCCDCGKNFTQSHALHTHRATVHTLTVYSSQLPPGTTDESLRKAIDIVRAKQIRYETDRKNPCGCPHCSRRFKDGFWLKTHILNCHMDDIISVLTNGEVIIKTENHNESGSGGTASGSTDQNLPEQRNIPQSTTPSKTCSRQGQYYSCSVCGESFSQESALIVHCQNIHPATATKKAKRFSCDHCSASFCLRKSLTNHLTVAHPLIKFAHLLPPQVDELQLNSVLNELVAKRKRIPRGFKKRTFCGCPHCPKRADDSTKLRIHILQSHFNLILGKFQLGPGPTPPHQPPAVKRRRKLAANAISKNRGRGPLTNCNICGTRFINRFLLLAHHKRLHSHSSQGKGNNGASFKCSHCGNCFSTSSSLLIHSKTIHPLATFSHKFPNGVNESHLKTAVDYILAQRVAVDKNKKKIGCPHCSATYAHAQKFKCHILTEHMDRVLESLEAQMEAELVENVELPLPSPSSGDDGQDQVEEMTMETNQTEFNADSESERVINVDNPILPSKSPLRDVDVADGENSEVKCEPDSNPRRKTKISRRQCAYCGKKFSRSSHLTEHLFVWHCFEEYQNQLPPSVTDTEFKDKLKYVMDKNKKGKGDNVSYGCLFCDGRYIKKAALKIHLLHMHLNQIFPEITNDEHAEVDCRNKGDGVETDIGSEVVVNHDDDKVVVGEQELDNRNEDTEADAGNKHKDGDNGNGWDADKGNGWDGVDGNGWDLPVSKDVDRDKNGGGSEQEDKPTMPLGEHVSGDKSAAADLFADSDSDDEVQIILEVKNAPSQFITVQ